MLHLYFLCDSLMLFLIQHPEQLLIVFGLRDRLKHFCISGYFQKLVMNLHPHAVLDRVLWRWYQIPFRL